MIGTPPAIDFLGTLNSTIIETIAGFEGVKLSELVLYIKMLKDALDRHGIKFGIERSSKEKAKFLGTITEFDMNIPDIFGNTINAAIELSKAIME